MSNKQDALIDIVDIMKRHALTVQDVAKAFSGDAAFEADKGVGVITRVFYYLGGILVLCGIGVLVAMQWDNMTSAMRVLATLGSGFCMYIMAVAASKEEKYVRLSTPLFIAANVFQPTGIMVALHEYSRGGDPLHGILFMTGVMFVQQLCTFISLRRTTLAMGSVFFGICCFATLGEIANIDEMLNTFLIGWILLGVARWLDMSPHKVISPLHYFFGAIFLLVPVYDWVEKEFYELLFLGVTTAMIVASVQLRSRMLLGVATIATILFIGDYSSRYFADTVGWPIFLMMMGVVLIGLSRLAVHINRKYIASVH